MIMKSKYLIMLPFLVLLSIFFSYLSVISNFSPYYSVLGYGLIFVTFVFVMVSEITNNFRATNWFLMDFFARDENRVLTKTGFLPWLIRRALVVSFSYSQMPFVIEHLQT